MTSPPAEPARCARPPPPTSSGRPRTASSTPARTSAPPRSTPSSSSAPPTAWSTVSVGFPAWVSPSGAVCDTAGLAVLALPNAAPSPGQQLRLAYLTFSGGVTTPARPAWSASTEVRLLTTSAKSVLWSVGAPFTTATTLYRSAVGAATTTVVTVPKGSALVGAGRLGERDRLHRRRRHSPDRDQGGLGRHPLRPARRPLRRRQPGGGPCRAASLRPARTACGPPPQPRSRGCGSRRS